MFQLDFGHNTGRAIHSGKAVSTFQSSEMKSVAWSFWEEHCLECAQPVCYTTCPLYVRRADDNCARFKSGIIENTLYPGLHGNGAEIVFRPWGKLQTRIGNAVWSPAKTRWISRMDAALSRGLVSAGNITHKMHLHKFFFLQRYYNRLRRILHEHCIHKANKHETVRFDAFVLEAWNLGKEPFRLIVEAQCNQQTVFRHSQTMFPGHNAHTIAWDDIALPNSPQPSRLVVHPENDYEAHLVFTWLDAVRYLKSPFPRGVKNPAPKVKCVVWDLDNTLWEGVLGDDGPMGVKMRQPVIDTIKHLDQRGIIQSIASKNDYDAAWSFLKAQSLATFFLYEEIHWGPKSESIRKIASNMNIGLDSFAFIDDSPFERGEVQGEIPEIRIYDPKDIPSLMEKSEFDVPVTDASGKRRIFYQTESKRKLNQKQFTSDYRGFLLNCQLSMRVSNVFEQASLNRCAELLQRTNQLNLSGRRLGVQEIQDMLQPSCTRCYWIACNDRYGDYGLVGFCAVLKDKAYDRITDFAFSCRVAKKKFENRLFDHLLLTAKKDGRCGLIADYAPTGRNHVLIESLEEVGFKKEPNPQDGNSLWVLSTSVSIPDTDLVELILDND